MPSTSGFSSLLDRHPVAMNVTQHVILVIFIAMIVLKIVNTDKVCKVWGCSTVGESTSCSTQDDQFKMDHNSALFSPLKDRDNVLVLTAPPCPLSPLLQSERVTYNTLPVMRMI